MIYCCGTNFILILAEVPMEEKFVVTTNYVPGHQVKDVLGAVWGLTVRSRGLGGNIAAGLRSLVGGEIKEYVKMLNDSRTEALNRMIEKAESMGANAIIEMSFDTSDISQYMTEIVAYGTAVKIEEVSGGEFVKLS